MLDRTAARPLWEQLLTDLRRRLDLDEFDRSFPGELALVAEYGVSRHTVREAVRRLREEGVVVAGRGRPPRRAEPAEIEQPLGEIYSLFTAVEATGRVQRSVVRTLDVRADGVVAARLGLEESTPLVHLERLRLADAEPLAVDRVWLPERLAAPLLEVDFGRTALYAEYAAPLRGAGHRWPRADPGRGPGGGRAWAAGHRARGGCVGDRPARAGRRPARRVAAHPGAGRPVQRHRPVLRPGGLPDGRRLTSAQPDVHPHRRAVGPAVHPHQVAHLVHREQPVPDVGRAGQPPPDQRIVDPAAVLHLADHLLVGDPDGEQPAAARVHQGVDGELLGGQPQVGGPVRRHPGPLGDVLHEPAGRARRRWSGGSP